MLKHPLSVVIVTYNSEHLIVQCLEKIYGQHSIEIVAFDNNSTDGTRAIIRAQFPQVKLIESRENLGFSKGNNRAFQFCSHPLILLLNPDAFIDDIAQLGPLIAALEEDPMIAMVGPQLVNADGSHQTGDCGWRDSLLSTAGHMLFLHRLFANLPSIYLTNPKLLRQTTVEVDWVCGACLLTRRSVIADCGGLNEGHFMYGEDVEWGERVRSAGMRVIYVPCVKILHLQGGTQRSNSQSFVSTKWLDHRARKHRRRSWFHFQTFRVVCAAGFLVRALSLELAANIPFGSRRVKPATPMWKYLRHIRQLSSVS